MQNARYPEVSDDFGHWLAGFIAGEGSFGLRHRTPSRDTGQWELRFKIALRADDRAILDESRRRTGLGNVSVTRPYGSHSKNPEAVWIVTRKRDLLRLVALLDRYPLRAKKARDYAIWREAVLYWGTLGFGRPRDWGPLDELAERLRATRAFGAPFVPGPAQRPPPTLFDPP